MLEVTEDISAKTGSGIRQGVMQRQKSKKHLALQNESIADPELQSNSGFDIWNDEASYASMHEPLTSMDRILFAGRNSTVMAGGGCF